MKYVVEVCDRGPETHGCFEVEVNRLGIVTDCQPTELPADELTGEPVVGRLAPDLERDLHVLFDRVDIAESSDLIALRIDERLWGTISAGLYAYITIYDEELKVFVGTNAREAMNKLWAYYSGTKDSGTPDRESGSPF